MPSAGAGRISMGKMTDQVIMQGLTFYGYVGVLPVEKEKGQPFILDVILHCDRILAAENDNLADTIHYGQAFTLIKGIVENSRCDLIEKLAGDVARALLAEYALAQAVEVTVRKPKAPVPGVFDYMGCRIWRSRTGEGTI